MFWAFCFGAIVGGVFGLIMILIRRQFERERSAWCREIMTDLQLSPPARVQASPAGRGPPERWVKLPYGIPLCVGFLLYLGYVLVSENRDSASSSKIPATLPAGKAGMNYRTVKLRILRTAPKTGKTEVTRRSGSNLKAGKSEPLHRTSAGKSAKVWAAGSSDPRRPARSGSRGSRYAQLSLGCRSHPSSGPAPPTAWLAGSAAGAPRRAPGRLIPS